ncbi:hypothetical protein OPEN69S_00524 [Ottowia pentelensis]
MNDFERKNTMNPDSALPIEGLETVYDTLALAIDQAGADKADLFLVKLALLNANALADAALFERQVQAALQDL